MKIILIDNYDSFTYNLVHYIEKINGCKPDVFRNDELTLNTIASYDKILLSPGPGLPEDAGITLSIIKNFAGKIPILGVCLGHQAIAVSFGAELYNLSKVCHGVRSKINLNPSLNNTHFKSVFHGFPRSFYVGRYHSWAVKADTLPIDFFVSATDETGCIMAIEHKFYDLKGVQFHPESILSEHGERLFQNWLFA